MNKVILKDIGFTVVGATTDIKDPMYKKLSIFSKTVSRYINKYTTSSNEGL